MIQGSFIQQSIRDGSCVMYHDYRLGHALDLSGNGNNGTLVAPALFQRNGVFIEANNATAAITVPYAASIAPNQETTVSLFAGGYGPWKVPGSGTLQQYMRYVNAADNHGVKFISAGSSNSFALDNPATPTTIVNSVKIVGAVYLGINQSVGGGPSAYINGVRTGTSATAQVFAPAVATMFIGNFGGRGVGGCYSTFMMFNRELTATEHARLYGELMK